MKYSNLSPNKKGRMNTRALLIILGSLLLLLFSLNTFQGNPGEPTCRPTKAYEPIKAYMETLTAQVSIETVETTGQPTATITKQPTVCPTKKPKLHLIGYTGIPSGGD